MPAILKIGYHEFLCKSDAQAAAALKALSEAVALENTYHEGRYVYFPAEDRPLEIGMTIVRKDQLRTAKPGKEPVETEVVRKPLQLNPAGPDQLTA